MDSVLAIVNLMASFLTSTAVIVCGGSVPWYIYIIALSVGLGVLSIFIPWLSGNDDDDE